MEMFGMVEVPSGNAVSASERRGGAPYKYQNQKEVIRKMKKQLAIATVAIMLTAVLIAPPVMAFTVRDGNSVQYSSHRGLNYITDNSVTASNRPYITLSNGIGVRETSSRVKYYRAPVPVRTSNQPIVRGNEITSNQSIFRDTGMLKPKESTPRYSADGVRMRVITITIPEDYAKRIAELKNGSTMGMPNSY